MTIPDFDAACAYALDRLEYELASELLYHSVAHTRDDVLPAIDRLADIQDIRGEAYLVLRTAAAFHDIGFIEQYFDHEAVSMRIAREILPRFGFNQDYILVIERIIAATKLPQSPHTELEQIMVDADLDILGRPDFWDRNQALRDELSTYRGAMTDLQWYQDQIEFMSAHTYFTFGARALRSDYKQRNLSVLQQRRMELLRND